MARPNIEAAREYHQAREAGRYSRREQAREEWQKRVRQAVSRLAPHYPAVQRVFLFGSILQAGRFRATSDIDLALECDSVEIESRFWRALERELKRDVDLRPLTGGLAAVVLEQGEQIYERQNTGSEE